MIYRANSEDATAVARLAHNMWVSHTEAELAAEFAQLLARKDAAVFLLHLDGKPAGFAQCQLRRDYVEGTESSPVGYLEGVFVAPEYRKQGHGAMLVNACEQWAKEQGCREFASDCELDNSESLAFHLHTGFQEANRIICFVKALS